MDRDGEGWSDPLHLAGVSSEADELGASVTADGVLWFASDRPGGAAGWDLYAAALEGDEAAAPTPVDEFNSEIWEFNPAISADGDLLVFTSIGRPGGPLLGDLFSAHGRDGAWQPEEPLPVNSPADEYHASFSPDGETLYFVRRATDGDLYEVGLAGALIKYAVEPR
ncbi:MAG: TolB family protein [Candidatus Limnocylindria bacterium]